MKKWISVFLCVLLLLNLAGTALAESGQESGDSDPPQAQSGPEDDNETGDDSGTGAGDGPNTGGSPGTEEDEPGTEDNSATEDKSGAAAEDGGGDGDAGDQPQAGDQALTQHFWVEGNNQEEDGILTLVEKRVTVKMAEGVSQTDHIIKVGPGVEEVIIDGLHIVTTRGPAMDLSGSGDVTVLLRGENHLESASGSAGIVTGSGTLTIGNTPEGGSLTAVGGDKGAGIGGNSGAAGGAVVIAGGSVTAVGGTGAAGIGGGAGVAASGAVAVNGGSLTASGSPALGTAPAFDPGYIHVSYSGSEGAKNVAEWTGSPLPAESWSDFTWVQILPMTVNALIVTPAEATLTLTPPGPATAPFTAALDVTAGGESLTPLDVTKLTVWSVSSSASGIQEGLLTVPYSEPANSLTVTAVYEATGSSGTAQVTLLRPATAITLDKTELTLTVGDSATLKATVEPGNTTDALTWSVSPEGVVDVDQNGNLKALTVGEANVTATAGRVSASCRVTVKAPPQIYTVRFDANGGNCGTSTMTTGPDGTLPSLPQASKTGVYFAGWYTAKTGGTRVFLSTVYHADTTLYAHWSDVPVTGDENNPVLWAALVGVSALAVCAVGMAVLVKKRRGKK